MNIVVHLHTDTKKLLEYIKKVKPTRDDVYECAMDNMIQDGYKFGVITYDNFWGAIKYPWHTFTVVERFLGQVKRSI